MKLRNVIFKSENLVIQKIMDGTESTRRTCIIMGSGYSLSVDDDNDIVYKDPLFFPPSGKKYGNHTVLSLFYTFQCEGLDASARELARFIDTRLNGYDRVILHGHSKCGSHFLKATEYLNRRVTIISVSAPLNTLGTPITDRKLFASNLNWFFRKAYGLIFSDHNVDRDLCRNSDFLTNLNLKYLSKHNHIIVVSKCPKFPLTPLDLFLKYIDKKANINGDGIIPRASQLPAGYAFHEIEATHASSMSKTILYVSAFCNEGYD